FFYASTNKVYGAMEGVTVEEEKGSYRYQNLPFGVSEDQCLDFHSPYGCSKGAADQYVLDYARIYGLPTVVFRQSCIYGCRQFGVEDQGWVAWFVIAAEMGLPITVYGNGNQVRDILFVDDLLAAYDAALERVGTTAGGFTTSAGGPITRSPFVNCCSSCVLNVEISNIGTKVGGPGTSGYTSAIFAAP